jgi:hypothetical protein
MADVTIAPAKEKAQEAAGEAKQQASTKLREQVEQRSTQAAEQVSGTASDLRSVSEELRNQGKDTPARLAEQAAQRTERLGGYLRESDADRILGDVEDFARRQPWAVVAGGVALGFVASRFLKASSSDRYKASQGSIAGNGHSRTAIAPPPAPSPSAYPAAPAAPAPPAPPVPGATLPPR